MSSAGVLMPTFDKHRAEVVDHAPRCVADPNDHRVVPAFVNPCGNKVSLLTCHSFVTCFLILTANADLVPEDEPRDSECRHRRKCTDCAEPVGDASPIGLEVAAVQLDGLDGGNKSENQRQRAE
jgi:hypothetical protein